MPYVKWHGRDWLGDPLIRMITPELRGVWIDLLCAMMQAEPYGYLAVNGKAMTDEQAARLTGLNIDTYKECLKGIEDAGISSRTPCGMLYSRRLVRDYKKFVKASECGKRGGGNPALKIDSESRSHSPEAIVQKPEAKGSLKLPIKDGIKVESSSLVSEGGCKGEKAKKQYGELKQVLLTDDEMVKLLSKHTQSQINEAIEILDGYIASKGAKYKNHYAVLKETSWVWDRVREKMANQPPKMSDYEKRIADGERRYREAIL